MIDGYAATHIQKNRFKPNKQALAKWKLAARISAIVKLIWLKMESGKSNSKSITAQDMVNITRGDFDHDLNDSLTGYAEN